MANESEQAPAGGPLVDLKLCFAALTRLRMRLEPEEAARPLAAAAWAFPVVGIIVGLIAAAVLQLALGIGLTPWVAAVLAIAAELGITGALHEDGLADVADGFGGGRDREHKLAIMRDSRIGVYGVVTLVIALALRIAAIAEIGTPSLAAAALVSAAALSRASVAGVMWLGAPARTDGLGAAAGRARSEIVALASAIAVIVAMLIAGLLPAIVAAIAATAGGLIVLDIANRQIGGTTGDVLGAAQQIAEIAALLAFSATLSA